MADVEVLDLTTPQQPTPRSRVCNGVEEVPGLSSPHDSADRNEVGASVGTKEMRKASEEDGEKWGLATQQWQSNDESDDDFSMGASVSLWDRLKRKTAPSPAARKGSTSTAHALNHSTTTQPPRWQVDSSTTDAAASSSSFGSTKPPHSTPWAMYVGDSDDGGKQTGRATGEGISTNLGPACRVDAGGDRSQEKGREDTGGELVNLLSDSDDEERCTGARATGATANTEDSSASTGRFGQSAADCELGLEQLGDDDSLGVDDLDALVLSSQTSSRSSPPRPTRALQDQERSDPRGTNLTSMPDDRQASDEDEDFSLEVYATSAARRVLKGGSASERGTRSSSAGSGRGERGVAAVDSGASTRAVDVPMTKEDKALARKEAAASKKRQRQEAAAAAKLQKERERQEKKLEQERAKQTANAEKAVRAEKGKQARGLYSHREIACVMEQGYFRDPRSEAARAAAVRQPSGAEEFTVTQGDFCVPGAIWWTRRAHLDGGAAASGLGVETLDILAVVVYPEQLLQNLRRYYADARDGNVFPDLGRFVDTIRTSVREFSRIILILEGAEMELNKRWSQPQRSGGGSSAATRTEVFEDAQSWLLIHKDVETRVTKDGADTGQYLWDLTRALSTIPYKDDVTELHCVPRFKTRARGSENLAEDDQKLADTWVRMLRQIPDIGESKAVEIAAHYPLPRDLVRALSDPSVPEQQRPFLLADKMGSGRSERKYARRVFDLFTQEDGDFVLK